ncbi:class I SAM-dependent methyltransferase [Streptomyces sp. NRRL S-87]|uniref:class I SAM-dependent methyltransferase n=1 Tax=Streptomyces sp. NRRL S-87 TaxID=1463920 RepID=UPI0004C1C9B7|nr:methyltransferase domain-containing protein [Streptomyces sp. NRRL S-87]
MSSDDVSHEQAREDPADAGRPDADRGTDWTGAAGARAFAAVTADTDWLLGYPFVFEALARRVREGDVLVDFGCGPGRVAGSAAARLGVRLVGVDTSPEMLALARELGTPGAEYHLVENGRATGLPDACADAVMCNHVLASLPSEDAVLGVFAEVRRLLRPGGLFVLLSTDPACAGRPYASLRIGDAGRAYRPGEELTLRLLRTDGSWQEVRNRAWPVEVFPRLLERARFREVVQRRPTVDEAVGVADAALVHGRTWDAERAWPPLVVTTAVAT